MVESTATGVGTLALESITGTPAWAVAAARLGVTATGAGDVGTNEASAATSGFGCATPAAPFSGGYGRSWLNPVIMISNGFTSTGASGIRYPSDSAFRFISTPSVASRPRPRQNSRNPVVFLLSSATAT